MSAQLPIVDAHRNFWDPRANYHLVAPFPALEQRALFHDNALRLYAME